MEKQLLKSMFQTTFIYVCSFQAVYQSTNDGCLWVAVFDFSFFNLIWIFSFVKYLHKCSLVMCAVCVSLIVLKWGFFFFFNVMDVLAVFSHSVGCLFSFKFNSWKRLRCVLYVVKFIHFEYAVQHCTITIIKSVLEIFITFSMS